MIFLSRSVPIKVESYDPMQTELVLEFSKIGNASDALAFANNYGFLEIELEALNPAASNPVVVVAGLRLNGDSAGGIVADSSGWPPSPFPVPAVLHDSLESMPVVKACEAIAAEQRATDSLPRQWPREPVSLWLEEASTLKKLFDLWGAIQQRNVKAGQVQLAPSVLRNLLNQYDSYHPPFDDVREHIRGLPGRARKGDPLELAKVYLAEAINCHLQPSSAAPFVSLDWNGGFKIHYRPTNLRTALWVQLSEIVTGVRKIRRCEICGELMDVTNRTRRKKVHDCCSRRERMQRYRKNRR
jgi:hypothetical protein